MNIWPFLQNIDEALIRFFQRYGHRVHRLSLGVLYVWFGLLKPLGHNTESVR